ncbi:MAG: 3-dehydroquinate synthase [Candidatus Izemoplasmatales bacterium]|jgi:3-dehydroquinate synthase
MKLTVKSNRFNYDVIIERNLLDQIEKWIDVKKAYAVISDDNIPKEIINKVISKLNNYMFIEFPEGEKSKSIEQYSRIINLLIDNGVNKDINIIALGGGVTGDLVGFISSTLYRGVNLIQIPTTLLSQIDSSIGGKVAINMDNVKNSVGNIYPPSLVLIDPETLNSLPDRHFNNGMAEMIKYGMIYSRELFDFIKNKNVKENIDKLIYECLKIKKYYVEIDEFDNDSRYILNFGHTYGHAYEAYYNFDKYLHGEAISLGMIKTTSKNIKEELISVLKKFSLPTEDNAEQKELIKYIKRDKKSKGESIKMVFVDQIGYAYLDNKNINEL